MGVLVCVFLVAPAAAVADETDDLIKDILREASNSAKAAGELINSAKRLGDSPTVQTRLCEKAYECGIAAPAGYASALAALDLLAKIAPVRAVAWDDKRLEVFRLRYLRGDRRHKPINGRKYVEMLLARAEKCGKANKWSDAAKLSALAYGVARTLRLPEKSDIYQRMREANNWMMVYNRLASLKKAVEKNPGDLPSRKRLVETYLIELDMPAEASKHLTDKLDSTLRKNVSLAAREASGLADADFLTLGQWYQSLAARTAARMAKRRLLTRARDNLKMYLEVHTKKDVQRLRVAKMLEAVEAELKRLGADLPAGTIRGQTLTLKLGNGVTMKFVHIPAGKFTMSSPQTETGRKANEGPQRPVAISKSFHMGVTEVTQKQYAALGGRNLSSKFKGPGNPVDTVSKYDADAFCKALSKKTARTVRLPTEAEWEYACRAGAKSRFGFGNDDRNLGAHGWYKDNSGVGTHAAGKKRPNAWGLYDMHGNVWEWCSNSVLRGGAWNSPPDNCRTASRRTGDPYMRTNFDGFRVVVESNSGGK